MATSNPQTASDLTTDELVRLVQGGRTAYYREIVSRYQPDVLRIVTTTLYDRSQREDLVQQVFVNAFARVHEVRGGDFSNWGRSYRLALGNEFTHNRTWEGAYHLVAIYSRSLPADNVRRNFRAGTSLP